MSNTIRGRSALAQLRPNLQVLQPREPRPPRSSTSSTADASSFDQTSRAPRPPFVDSLAKTLGLGADELEARMRGGESIEDLADAQGVARETVASTLAADFQALHPEATDAQAAAVSQRLMQGASAQAEPPALQRPPFLDAAAEALGLDSDTLEVQLQAGKSLADVAEAQGVSTGALEEALTADFQARHPGVSEDEASDLSSRLLEQRSPTLRKFRVNELALQSLAG